MQRVSQTSWQILGGFSQRARRYERSASLGRNVLWPVATIICSDILGLARQTITRRNGDLDDAVRANLRHHPGQRAALPHPVRTRRRHPHTRSRARRPLRRPDGDDAAANDDSGPKQSPLHRHPAPAQSGGPAIRKPTPVGLLCRPHRATATMIHRHSDGRSTVYADVMAKRRHSPGTPLSS